MKRFLTTTLETIAPRIPLQIYPLLMRRELIDFFYHIVSDDPMPYVRHLYPVVPVLDFEAALSYLKENYTFVSYSQVHAHVLEGTPLPPKAVHLSFDDGYVECYSVVRPLLLKHQVPGTFFITTGLIDNAILFYRNKQSLCVDRLLAPDLDLQSLALSLPASAPALASDTLPAFISWFKDLRLPDEPLIDEICYALGVDGQAFLRVKQPYLTTDQIRQMHAEGFTIGAHTVTHRKLMDLPSDEIESEIVTSCQAVKEITGQDVVPFSFPNSAWGLDRAHLAAIRERHPGIGLLFDTKGVRRDAHFILNRVWAERPLTSQRKLHPIPEVLRNAYEEAWVEEVWGWGRRVKNR